MKRPEVYGLTVTYEDKLDLYLKAVKTYVHIKSLFNEELSLSNRPLEFLSYYMLEGYSGETKEFMMKSMGIKTKNINTVNRNLTMKGYLVPDMYNMNIKHLNKELQLLKEYIDKGEDLSKFFLIKFNRGVN